MTLKCTGKVLLTTNTSDDGIADSCKKEIDRKWDRGVTDNVRA